MKYMKALISKPAKGTRGSRQNINITLKLEKPRKVAKTEANDPAVSKSLYPEPRTLTQNPESSGAASLVVVVVVVVRDPKP